MVMHKHVTCKKNCIIGKNPIQITIQAYNPRMHGNMIIMIENAIHGHMIIESQDPSQKFYQKHKNFKYPNKNKSLEKSKTTKGRRFLVKRWGLDRERGEKDRNV